MGLAHPHTLMTIMNMANTHKELKDFTKAERIYRQALDGHERSLGKDHEDTKYCARNLAVLLWETQLREYESPNGNGVKEPHSDRFRISQVRSIVSRGVVVVTLMRCPFLS